MLFYRLDGRWCLGLAFGLVLESRGQQPRNPFIHLLGEDWVGMHWQPNILPIAPDMVGQPDGHRRGTLGAPLAQAAEALRQLAEAPAQHAPTLRPCLTSTRLTAQAALEALPEQGDGEAPLPSPSTMAEGLNRLGLRLRKVVQAKPPKKIPETDAIVDHVKKKRRQPSQREMSNAGGWMVKRP